MAWLGLKKIRPLTRNKSQDKLCVDLGVTKNKIVCAEYA